ncbi:hypothetical protein TH61_03125 [Rufibacter sp. DG15C]|uniref:hypothetical protein n=1 Tax=Rufibacter sp. DG15C TaxID=1379909 RepID=UPI00078E783C|nr:hypothetical protein [Rufibacter sp. DG15C]AMM50374.1 hypothetical protein TH61_03125 [Rufibacter sp. DG15C]
MTFYRYLGDKHTDPALKGATCEAVRQENGKCIRGKNGSMLVRFLHLPYPTVVIGRLLRKVKPDEVLGQQP